MLISLPTARRQPPVQSSLTDQQNMQPLPPRVLQASRTTSNHHPHSAFTKIDITSRVQTPSTAKCWFCSKAGCFARKWVLAWTVRGCSWHPSKTGGPHKLRSPSCWSKLIFSVASAKVRWRFHGKPKRFWKYLLGNRIEGEAPFLYAELRSSVCHQI